MRITLILCLVAFVPALWAADDTMAFISVTHANDVFLGEDRHFTAGSRLSYVSAANSHAYGLAPFIHSLPMIPQSAKVRIGFAVSQDIFTPEEITAPNPPLTDRPYLGLLHVEGQFFGETEHHLSAWRLRLGISGEASLGRLAQRFIHEVISSPDPLGWPFQIPTEPVFGLSYSRIWRMPLSTATPGKTGWDMLPRAGATVGTQLIEAEAGAVFRFGTDLTADFGYSRFAPGIGAPSFYDQPEDGFGWYIFAGAMARVQAHNMALDGGVFRASRSVTRRPLQADIVGGLALLFETAKLTGTFVMKTEEFEGQQGVDSFVSLTATFPF